MRNILLAKTFSVFTLVALLAGCSADEMAISENVWDAQDEGYTLTVTLSKPGSAGVSSRSDSSQQLLPEDTRALSESGQNIVATWAEGDEIEVWSKEYGDSESLYKMGTIKARGTGQTVIFSGTLTTANATHISNWITNEQYCPIFLSYLGSPFNYKGQDGKLATIAGKYDYAYSSQINATAIDTSSRTITIGSGVTWENQQAIVKFVFKDANGNDISPDLLKISAKDRNGAETIYSSYDETLGSSGSSSITSPLTIFPDGSSNNVYVALNTKSSKAQYTLTARVGYTKYYAKTISGLEPFGKGKYYTVIVKMDPISDEESKKLNPLTVEAANAGTLTFKNEAEGPVEYSTDLEQWTEIAAKSTANIDMAAGGMVYLRGNNSSYANSNISCSSDFYVYGNIMSLVNSTDFSTATTVGSQSFYRLFAENPYLKSHPSRKLVLPATTLDYYCYGYMFYECDALTTCPIDALPATTLADRCYSAMFHGCSRLTEAPELPATTLADYCYNNMFFGCASLATAPTLSATTLTQYCYSNMFRECQSLTTAPTLPATVMKPSCYDSMFEDCSSLTTIPHFTVSTAATSCCSWMFGGCTKLAFTAETVPTLSATTLADYCYNSMFRNCASLTVAPTLPATTLAKDCYYSMFYGCSGLTAAPALPATTLAKDCYYSMFYGCSSLTAAPALPATTLYADCYRGMFEKCTNLATAPALPATTLASNCYMAMFRNCSSLTTAPELPAATLVEGCYDRMFSYCASLNHVKCLATTNIGTGSRQVFNWLSGVAATGTFIKAPGAIWPEGTIPSGWTVQDAN